MDFHVGMIVVCIDNNFRSEPVLVIRKSKYNVDNLPKVGDSLTVEIIRKDGNMTLLKFKELNSCMLEQSFFRSLSEIYATYILDTL